MLCITVARLRTKSVNGRQSSEAYGDLDRRVELVMLHDSDADPKGTMAWLEPRPQLQRHHHIRLANDKVQIGMFEGTKERRQEGEIGFL